MDLSGLFRAQDSPRGVLSASLFGGLLLTFDFPRNRISFEPGALGPADGSEIFEYDTGDELPVIPVVLAGVTVDFHLDTGSRSGFTLPGIYRDKLPLLSRPVETGRVHLVGREVVEYGSRLNGVVTFGRYSYENPEIHFIEALPVGNMGYEILRDFTVTMDSTNRRLKMERSAEVASLPAARPRRYGVKFYDVEASPLQVAGVDGDSVAAEAGLQPGDRIVEMNGIPIGSLNLTERINMLRKSPLALAVERGGKAVEIRMRLE
jgi:membrane-associated protease RseP (regulator of RpoE activity)